MKRLLALLFTLFLVFLGTRLIIRALPGDPLETIIAETGSTIPEEELRKELKLDRPFAVALSEDLVAAARGDLGKSIHSGRPVTELLGSRFHRTAQLTFAALLIGLAFSLALGIGATQSRSLDRFCTLYGATTAALPTAWIGPILIYLLAVKIQLFPLGGSVALPALTLAIGFSGFWSRLIRERVRETLAFGAARAARARGIPEWKVLLKYGLAPCSGALVAYLGTQAGSLLAGAFITEIIFAWPGMGSLFIEAVLKRDYPLVEASAFVGAATCLVGTALGDLAQRWIHPREEAE